MSAASPSHASQSGRLFFATGIGVLILLGVCFALDTPIYDFLHQHYNHYTRPVPDYLKLPTRVLRALEDWGEFVYISAVAYVIWVLDRQRRSQLFCLVLSALLVTGVVEAIKRVTGRERPEVSKGAFVFHGVSRWQDGGDAQSFPSGHMASASAYSGTLAAYHPALRPVVVALAVGCGANRVWKERHFLSDVFFGGVIGFGIAFSLPRWRFVQPMLCWFDRRFSEPGLTSDKCNRMAGAPKETSRAA